MQACISFITAVKYLFPKLKTHFVAFRVEAVLLHTKGFRAMDLALGKCIKMTVWL